jgi:hypothetical protein
MKQVITLAFIILLIAHFAEAQIVDSQNHLSLFSTDSKPYLKDNVQAMEFWVLPFTGAGSPVTRIPGNTWRFQRTQYLVRANEIANSGFPTGATIDGIGFFIAEQGVGTQTGNLKMYLKNTSDVTNSLGTNWTTTDFTLVCDIPNWTVPITTGLYNIPFSGGSPFVYTGEGVYVAFEFSNPNGDLGTTALSARCNDQLSDGLRGNRNNASMPTTLPASAFRPVTLFINDSLVDVASINNIFTLEKVALGYAQTPISVLVSNVSTSIATFDVAVQVKDTANATTFYTATQTVTDLAGGASTMVNFAGWAPSVIGDVVVTAEILNVPGENWLSNNRLSIKSNVNSNTLSYTFDNSNPPSFGYNHPNSGLFLSRYKMQGIGSVNGANIVISNGSTVPGNTIYAVVLNASGTILSQSANYVIQASDLGTTKNFTFPSPPTFEDEDFFVGLAQTAGTATWRPLGMFSENPQRQNTFYAASLNGSNMSEIESGFRLKFGIEAVVSITTSLSFLHTENITIYPNPVYNKLNISVSATHSSSNSWSIIDTKGKSIMNGTHVLGLGQNNYIIETAHLSPGMYILKYHVNGHSKFFRLVKE